MPKLPGHYHFMTYGFNSLWVGTGNDSLDRIDPATGKIIASIKLGDGFEDNQNEMQTSASAVWVNHEDEQEVIMIDPLTNSIVSKTPYTQLIAQARARGSVPPGKGTDFIWILATNGLLRIDPSMGTGLTFLPLDAQQLGIYKIAVADDAVWVAGVGQIERVNVATNQVDATYTTHDRGISFIGTGFGSVWMVFYNTSLVQRLDIVP